MLDIDLTDAAFDEATHTWVLPTARARIVVADQIRSGRDNLAPYLGVAVHGAPNYFMVTGAGRDTTAPAVRRIAKRANMLGASVGDGR